MVTECTENLQHGSLKPEFGSRRQAGLRGSSEDQGGDATRVRVAWKEPLITTAAKVTRPLQHDFLWLECVPKAQVLQT